MLYVLLKPWHTTGLDAVKTEFKNGELTITASMDTSSNSPNYAWVFNLEGGEPKTYAICKKFIHVCQIVSEVWYSILSNSWKAF